MLDWSDSFAAWYMDSIDIVSNSDVYCFVILTDLYHGFFSLVSSLDLCII